MKNANLVIVDDHRILLDGLTSLFCDVPSINIVATYSTSDDLILFLRTHEVHVILFDMHRSIQNGCAVANEVKRLFPQVKILILSMLTETNEINRCLETPVEGYILKRRGFDELVKAIQVVAHGGCYFDHLIMKNFINNIGQTIKDPGQSRNKLTPTELKVVQLLCAEKDNKTIYTEMGIVKSTLAIHMNHIYRKLRVHSHIGVVKYALKNDLAGVGIHVG